jgi:Acyl-CoA synthetase (NDP forming)
LIRQSEWARRPARDIPDSQSLLAKPSCVREIFANARARGERKLTESEALAVIEAYGIPAARSHVAHNATEASEIAEEVGWPVAMKIVSPQVVHKTDVGGVRLNIQGAKEATVAYREIVEAVHAGMPEAEISGVLVQHQVEPGRELICGITRQKGLARW